MLPRVCLSHVLQMMPLQWFLEHCVISSSSIILKAAQWFPELVLCLLLCHNGFWGLFFLLFTCDTLTIFPYGFFYLLQMTPSQWFLWLIFLFLKVLTMAFLLSLNKTLAVKPRALLAYCFSNCPHNGP